MPIVSFDFKRKENPLARVRSLCTYGTPTVCLALSWALSAQSYPSSRRPRITSQKTLFPHIYREKSHWGPSQQKTKQLWS